MPEQLNSSARYKFLRGPPSRTLDQLFLQPFACAKQRRRDTTHGYVQNLGHFGIRHTLDLTHNENLTIFDRQLLNGRSDKLDIGGPDCEHFGCSQSAHLYLCFIIMERRERPLWKLFAQPRIARIAHNLEQPCAAIAFPEAVKEPESPKVGVLNRIFSVLHIAGQPSRQRVCCVEMRKHRGFKSSATVCRYHAYSPRLLATHFPSSLNLKVARLMPESHSSSRRWRNSARIADLRQWSAGPIPRKLGSPANAHKTRGFAGVVPCSISSTPIR